MLAVKQDNELYETKESLVYELISKQLRSEQNQDVYDKRLTATKPPPGFDYVPRCIYFYYVRIDGNGKICADHYFYPNGPLDKPNKWQPLPYADVADPEGIVKRLALNARPSTRRKQPRKARVDSFSGVRWTRRGYIVIFFDEASWAFHRRSGGKPSVAFNVSEGHTPNQSFFDATDLVLDMPVRRTGRTDKRSAIMFVNHMRDGEDGGELGRNGPKEQSYKFDMYLMVQYANSDAPAMTVIFDPGGTNQGPPETP